MTAHPEGTRQTTAYDVTILALTARDGYARTSATVTAADRDGAMLAAVRELCPGLTFRADHAHDGSWYGRLGHDVERGRSFSFSSGPMRIDCAEAE